MRDFTDSYCEACGTRYTFGPTPSKGPSLAGARVLAKGLKNFVMSDEASMHDAMAAARIDVERGETARLAEEFHRTFNFCMTCRQYVCEKCWNPNQGACLSCSPLWDHESVAPKDHLIIRATVAQRALDGIAPTTRPTANAGVGGASAGAVPWPSEDPLPDRPEPRRNANHASQSTTNAPEAAQAAPAGLPAQPELATQPTQPPTAEPRPQIARSTAQERQAAQELRGQSPPQTFDEDAARLAPHEPARLADSETPARGAWEPETPVPQTAPSSDFDVMDLPPEPTESTEPPAPTEPDRIPVIGRLLGHRTPIAVSAQEQAPKAPKVLDASKPTKASAPDSIGGTGPWPQPTPWAQRPIERDDRRAASDAAPLEGAEAVSDAPVDAVEAASEPAAEPGQVAFAAPSPAVAEPVLPAQADQPVPAPATPEPAPTPATPGQLPLFTMPPATAERRPSTKGEVISRPAVDRPANDPPDEKWAIPASPAKRHPFEPAPVVSQSAEAPAPWPPIGAIWPPQNAPAAPWPGLDPALVSASVASAHQAELAESLPVAAIWAESAHEVLNRGSVRVCHRCALPVSTHARFCRRCGTQQA